MICKNIGNAKCKNFDAKCDSNAKHNSTKCSYTLGRMYLFLRDMSVCISKGKKYMVLLSDELPKGFSRRLTFSGSATSTKNQFYFFFVFQKLCN